MNTSAIQCPNPKCKDIIYSRAKHDLRRCTCLEISVDGGFDYMSINFDRNKPPKFIKIIVKATQLELYNDWNFSRNKFGLIKGKIIND